MKQPIALSFAATLAAVSVTACDEHGHDETVDLGTPRQLIYVTDEADAEKHGGTSTSAGQVHVFDAETFEHVGMFGVGAGPGEVFATPDGSMLWILSGSAGEVTLFDTTTYERIQLDVGVSPVHSFLATDRSRIFVGNDGSSDVSVISVAERRVTNTILTGAGHHKMAIVADGTAFGGLYVSNISDGSITPISTDLTVRTNVPGVGPAPHGMDYSFLTQRVYNCSGDAQKSVEVIATTDDAGTAENERDTIVARIPLLARCSYLHVSDDGAYAFATIPAEDKLARIRLSDHEVEYFDTADGPDKFEIVGELAYVVHSIAATVSVIDLTGATATVSIPVGAALAPGATSGHRSCRFDAGRLYVPNAYDGTVSVIDTATNTVLATLEGMHEPINVAVAGPSGGTTYPR